MTDGNWQDMIVGDRMSVDQDFGSRVRASQFSRQQWSLIMTSVELKIESDDGTPRLIADTSKLGHVLPELSKVDRGMGGMGTAGGGRSKSGGGLVDSLKSMLGIGSGADEKTRQAAEELAQEYATELQSRLEKSGKWDRVCDAAGQPSPE